MDNIIYNLVIMLFDRVGSEMGAKDVDDPKFRSFICDETGIPENDYCRIMGV